MFRSRVRGLMSSRSLLADQEEQSVGLLSTMEARAEYQKVKHYQTLYTFTTAVGIGLVALVLFWILNFRSGFTWQSNPGFEFNWHPFLMTLGMVFLYSQAILTYRTGRFHQKKPLKLLHAGLNFLAFILSVIGLKAVFDSHNLKGMANLYTLHSWLGLTTVILFSAQFLFGFITFLLPGLSQPLRKAVLPIHVAMGVGIFTGAIITAFSGVLEKAIFTLDKDYSKFTSESVVVNIIGICIALYGILVLYLVNDADLKRQPLSEDQIGLSRTE